MTGASHFASCISGRRLDAAMKRTKKELELNTDVLHGDRVMEHHKERAGMRKGQKHFLFSIWKARGISILRM